MNSDGSIKVEYKIYNNCSLPVKAGDRLKEHNQAET